MRAILYLGTTTGVHYIIYDLSEINKHFLPDSALFYAEKYKKAHLHQKTDVLLQKTKKKRLDRIKRRSILSLRRRKAHAITGTRETPHNVPYGCCFEQGLHSRKVASALVSSYLAFPSLPLSRRFLSVALSLGSPPAAVSSYSVSVKPGLSSGSPCGLSRRRMFHSFSKRV